MLNTPIVPTQTLLFFGWIFLLPFFWFSHYIFWDKNRVVIFLQSTRMSIAFLFIPVILFDKYHQLSLTWFCFVGLWGLLNLLDVLILVNHNCKIVKYYRTKNVFPMSQDSSNFFYIFTDKKIYREFPYQNIEKLVSLIKNNEFVSIKVGLLSGKIVMIMSNTKFSSLNNKVDPPIKVIKKYDDYQKLQQKFISQTNLLSHIFRSLTLG